MKKYFLILGIVALGSSCKKYVDVNDNPNTPTSSRAEFVFTNAVNVSAAYIVGSGAGMSAHQIGATWSGQWAHSTSFTGGGEEKTYQFSNANFNNFDAAYDNLNDYQYVINNADNDGKSYLIGPSKVMQCLIFQKLVDLYGDVPYSEALQGTQFVTPKYDNAQTIYESLIDKLTDAIANIKSASWPPSDPADIVFNGNKTKWVQFANTLKLRILMRQSFMTGRGAYITSKISDITAEGSGYITDNVLANPGYLKSPGKLNLFYGAYGYTENDVETGTFRFRKMNAVIINWLKNSSDVFRLQRIATPKVGGTVGNSADYVGVPLGAGGNGFLETLVSSIGSIQVVKGDASRPMIIMSAAEGHFLQAEARQNGWMPGSAQTSYETGVRWAFRLAAATHTSTATATNAAADVAANGYLVGTVPFADWSVSTDKIRTILIQKWVALCNVDGLEAWSEYRKSNGSSNGACPTSPKSTAVSPSTTEPVRIYYPLRETNVNSANVPTGINIFTSRIFWDPS